MAETDRREQRADDLFDKSKMSIGEHLDELRECLVKSLIGLGIGFVISLIFANRIVQFVQLPLVDGLKKFYTDRDSMRMQAAYDLTPAQVKALRDYMVDHQVTVELMMLERNELSRLSVPGDDPLAGGGGGRGAAAAKREGGEATDGEATDGEATDGEATGGEATDGEATDGEATDGEATDGEATDGAATSGGATGGGETDGEKADVVSRGTWQSDPQLVEVRVWKPLVAKVVSLSAPEAFLIWVKAAVIGGFVLSCWWIFLQIWNFVAKGLYPHERKYVYFYVPFSVVLFLSGMAMAFFVVFDFVLDFLFAFNASMGLEAEPRISEWLGFVLVLPVGFGIAFQLPLAMLLLHRIGMFTLEAYVSKWRLAVLVIFVLSMFLTPADPVSMLAMAGPLTALYGLGILLCKFMPRTRNPYAEGYEPGEA